jgi:hypothetical protein
MSRPQVWGSNVLPFYVIAGSCPIIAVSTCPAINCGRGYKCKCNSGQHAGNPTSTEAGRGYFGPSVQSAYQLISACQCHRRARPLDTLREKEAPRAILRYQLTIVELLAFAQPKSQLGKKLRPRLQARSAGPQQRHSGNQQLCTARS